MNHPEVVKTLASIGLLSELIFSIAYIFYFFRKLTQVRWVKRLFGLSDNIKFPSKLCSNSFLLFYSVWFLGCLIVFLLIYTFGAFIWAFVLQ